jgi:hypothetical protein
MRLAADLTNAKEMQTSTPAPKPAFETVSVECIESYQRFNGTSKARSVLARPTKCIAIQHAALTTSGPRQH